MTETIHEANRSEPYLEGPILVGTDFSEDSKAALAWACLLADSQDAPLVVLHVVHDLTSHPGFYHAKKTDHLEPMQDVAASMMDEFLDTLKEERPDLPRLETAQLQLVPGLPPTRILEVASILKARLIAIGGRGISDPPNTLLGTVAQRVIEHSTIPVVTVKSEAHGVMTKKEKKKQEKRKKKERKKLKNILGAGQPDESKDGVDG